MGEQVAAGSPFADPFGGLQEKVNPLDLQDGGIAQLGEHLPCKQGVKGSNPFISRMIFFGAVGRLQSQNGNLKAVMDGLIAQPVRAHA